MPDASIIVFPEAENLKKEIETLKQELTALFTECDELRYVICKNIEMKYMLLLGAAEHKLYKIYHKSLRLKRKIELIQMAKNRAEEVELEKIEEKLDEEMEEYKKLLEQQLKKLNDALKRADCETLNKEETKELKTLYHEIVKNLHPDINSDVTPEETELFYKAVEAYENGDLGSVRIIYEIAVVKNGDEKPNVNEVQYMLKEKLRLERIIEVEKRLINAIKENFPYTEKDLVDDPKQVEARLGEIETSIEYYEGLCEFYKDKIEEMTR